MSEFFQPEYQVVQGSMHGHPMKIRYDFKTKLHHISEEELKKAFPGILDIDFLIMVDKLKALPEHKNIVFDKKFDSSIWDEIFKLNIN